MNQEDFDSLLETVYDSLLTTLAKNLPNDCDDIVASLENFNVYNNIESAISDLVVIEG